MKQNSRITSQSQSEILKCPNSFYDRGKKAGKREGKREVNEETAVRLMEMGIDLSIVTKTTSLTREELMHLKK